MAYRTTVYKTGVIYLDQYLIEESQGPDLEICAHHSRKAVREIGFVSGKVSSDKIIDMILADFCMYVLVYKNNFVFSCIWLKANDKL